MASFRTDRHSRAGETHHDSAGRTFLSGSPNDLYSDKAFQKQISSFALSNYVDFSGFVLSSPPTVISQN
jgi:hypothetical protein